MGDILLPVAFAILTVAAVLDFVSNVRLIRELQEFAKVMEKTYRLREEGRDGR